VVIPVLVGTWLLLDALVVLSADVTRVMQDQQAVWVQKVGNIDQWLSSTYLAERLQLEAGEVTRSVRHIVSEAGRSFSNWLAAAGLSIFSLFVPTIVFTSLLGTLLSNSQRAIKIFKDLSPLDDSIDQLFLDRLRIMTKTMMLSIVVVAIVQGVVTGLLMALGGTPHIVPLTILATILAILPGGEAIIAIPVGIAHILVGNTWSGIIIILGTVTLVAALANQVRPLLVSKDAYLNRAFMLLSVLSGLAIFGFMGVVYGPLIMILFTTMLEVYLTYFRPGQPSVTVADAADGPVTKSKNTEAD
jgi:predicted PurR-regulated permease PerM